MQEYVEDKLANISDSLESLDPIDSIQIKLKQVLTIFLEGTIIDTFTSAQLITLEYLAGQCYYTFGPAIRLARIYYPVDPGYDDENCPENMINTNLLNRSRNSILIYPNPSNSLLQIKFIGQINATISICNMQGINYYNYRINEKDKEVNVNISDWPKGYYIITYITDKINSSKILISD